MYEVYVVVLIPPVASSFVPFYVHLLVASSVPAHFFPIVIIIVVVLVRNFDWAYLKSADVRMDCSHILHLCLCRNL